MAFLDDVRFPDRIALGAEGGPTFATVITTSTGGHEQRQANWAEARRRYNVATGLKQRADVEALLAFYIARRGQLRGFRFKDWSDYQLPRQPIGMTDGTQATFKITKVYSSGGEQVARRITRPVTGTVRCWVAGTERALGPGSAQFQVNLSSGVITLGAALRAPADQVIEASCEFDVPARFDTDALSLTLRTHDIGEWSSIPVVELRE
jgi:uncharacterized protein (TIGR02217 family)